MPATPTIPADEAEKSAQQGIVLNPPAALDAFAKQGNVTLDGNLSVAAGPVGRSAEASLGRQAAMYSYSRSQGLFAGSSLEGTAIGVRDDVKEAYYSKPVYADEILPRKVQPPAGARSLSAILADY